MPVTSSPAFPLIARVVFKLPVWYNYQTDYLMVMGEKYE